MTWYYVDSGKQAGPVDDAQLEALWRSGKVRPDTFVWHEGMEKWRPYSEVVPVGGGLRVAAAPPVVGTSSAGSGEAVCAECGKVFLIDDMIRFGEARVCAGCKPVFIQKLREGAKIRSASLNYAGFWIRFAAKFVDGLIIGVVFLLPLLIVTISTATTGTPDRLNMFQVIVQLGYYVANLFYSILFVGKFGATPGKMLCKLKVVNADGAKIGYGRATGRYFAEILSGIICNIGYIMAGFDEEKRALHDRICNTRVVFKSPA